MKKPTQKKPFKQQPKFPRIVYHILGILIILVSLWIADIITGALEKQKFMSLKQDMLALQAEFNKINPGWEYTAVCHANGEKFKSDEASSCYIDLSNKTNIKFSQNYYKITAQHNLEILQNKDYFDGFSNIRVIDLEHKNYKSLLCRISIIDGSKESLVSLGCHGKTKIFYFPKNQ